MTSRRVTTGDGGFTLDGLTKVSKGHYDVGQGGGAGISGETWRGEAGGQSLTDSNGENLLFSETQATDWFELYSGDETIMRYVEGGVYALDGVIGFYGDSLPLSGAQWVFTTSGTPDFIHLPAAKNYQNPASIIDYTQPFFLTHKVVANQSFRINVYIEGDDGVAWGRIQILKLA